MRYMIVAANNRDGFAVFHSRASPWNIHGVTPVKP